MGKSLTLDIGRLVDGLGRGARRKGRGRGRSMRGATSYYNPSLRAGVGKIALAPSRAEMDPMNLILGLSLVPTGLKLGTRLASASGLLGEDSKRERRATGEPSKAERYVELAAFGANFLGQLLIPGRKSSFFFGSMLGQVPTAAEALGDVLAGLFVDAPAAPAPAPAPEQPSAGTSGMGRLTDSEIRALVSGKRVGSYVTDMNNYEASLSSRGYDRTGHMKQMGSSITDMVKY